VKKYIDTLNKREVKILNHNLRDNMEKVRVTPFSAIYNVFYKIWNSKEEIEEEGQQEELLAKLAPREALELTKSLKRAGGMASKLSLERQKNDFKNSNKVEGDKLEKMPKTQESKRKSQEKEIVD